MDSLLRVVNGTRFLRQVKPAQAPHNLNFRGWFDSNGSPCSRVIMPVPENVHWRLSIQISINFPLHNMSTDSIIENDLVVFSILIHCDIITVLSMSRVIVDSLFR